MVKFYVIASEIAKMTGHNTFEERQLGKEKAKKELIDLILNRSGIVKKYITNNKHKEFTYWFRLVKKFKNRDTNEIKTIPNKQFSMKSLPSLSFKNFELIVNPIDIKINVHR